MTSHVPALTIYTSNIDTHNRGHHHHHHHHISDVDSCNNRPCTASNPTHFHRSAAPNRMASDDSMNISPCMDQQRDGEAITSWHHHQYQHQHQDDHSSLPSAPKPSFPALIMPSPPSLLAHISTNSNVHMSTPTPSSQLLMHHDSSQQQNGTPMSLSDSASSSSASSSRSTRPATTESLTSTPLSLATVSPSCCSMSPTPTTPSHQSDSAVTSTFTTPITQQPSHPSSSSSSSVDGNTMPELSLLAKLVANSNSSSAPAPTPRAHRFIPPPITLPASNAQIDDEECTPITPERDESEKNESDEAAAGEDQPMSTSSNSSNSSNDSVMTPTAQENEKEDYPMQKRVKHERDTKIKIATSAPASGVNSVKSSTSTTVNNTTNNSATTSSTTTPHASSSSITTSHIVSPTPSHPASQLKLKLPPSTPLSSTNGGFFGIGTVGPNPTNTSPFSSPFQTSSPFHSSPYHRSVSATPKAVPTPIESLFGVHAGITPSPKPSSGTITPNGSGSRLSSNNGTSMLGMMTPKQTSGGNGDATSYTPLPSVFSPPSIPSSLPILSPPRTSRTDFCSPARRRSILSEEEQQAAALAAASKDMSGVPPSETTFDVPLILPSSYSFVGGGPSSALSTVVSCCTSSVSSDSSVRTPNTYDLSTCLPLTFVLPEAPRSSFSSLQRQNDTHAMLLGEGEKPLVRTPDPTAPAAKPSSSHSTSSYSQLKVITSPNSADASFSSSSLPPQQHPSPSPSQSPRRLVPLSISIIPASAVPVAASSSSADLLLPSYDDDAVEYEEEDQDDADDFWERMDARGGMF